VPVGCTQLGVMFNATPSGTAGAVDFVQYVKSLKSLMALRESDVAGGAPPDRQVQENRCSAHHAFAAERAVPGRPRGLPLIGPDCGEGRLRCPPCAATAAGDAGKID
jgi:hypothetical protein